MIVLYRPAHVKGEENRLVHPPNYRPAHVKGEENRLVHPPNFALAFHPRTTGNPTRRRL